MACAWLYGDAEARFLSPCESQQRARILLVVDLDPRAGNSNVTSSGVPPRRSSTLQRQAKRGQALLAEGSVVGCRITFAPQHPAVQREEP